MWFMLRTMTDPGGNRMFGDAGGLAAWGILLIAAGAYLVRGDPKPNA
jgi:hypothetical protein